MKLFSCVMVCSTTCDSKQRYGGGGVKKRKRFGSGRVINPEHDSTQASFGFSLLHYYRAFRYLALFSQPALRRQEEYHQDFIH